MAASWLGTIFNFLAGGQYNNSPPAITPGSSGPLQCDQYGRLFVVLAPPVSGVGYTTFADPGACNSAVIKNSAGSLVQMYGSNESGALRYIMVFDAISLPANGATPKIQLDVPANGTFSLSPSQQGTRPFVNGIVIASSSTKSTLTVDLTAGGGMWLNAEYV